MELLFNNEIAKETKYKGYFATKSGLILTAKVKGGQGRIDYNNIRKHCYKVDKDGYYEVLLSNSNNRKYVRVHRLVWETFNGDIQDNLTIDHIDKDVSNNNLTNLRLLTREDNTSIAIKGVKSPKRKLYLYKNKIYDRQELQDILGFGRKFWYKESNKINKIDFIYKDTILKQVIK